MFKRRKKKHLNEFFTPRGPYKKFLLDQESIEKRARSIRKIKTISEWFYYGIIISVCSIILLSLANMWHKIIIG